MTTQVYRHKIRLITDAMIGRAVTLGIEEDKIAWLKSLYSYDGTKEYLREYLAWFDDRIINEILGKNTPDGYAKDLFLRLQNRRLFKCILDVDQNDFPDPFVRNFVFSSKDFYVKLEEEIGALFGFDKNHVIAYTISFDSAVRTESQIPVLHQIKPATLFDDESALFKSVDRKIREQRFQVYAPAVYKDEKDRKKQLSEYRDGILKCIIKLADPQNSLPLDGA